MEGHHDGVSNALIEAERRHQTTPRLSPFDSQLGMTHGYDDLDLEASDMLSELFPAVATIRSTPLIQDLTNNIGVTLTLQTLSPSPIQICNSPTPPIGVSPVGATVDMPVGAVGSATVTSASAPPRPMSTPPSRAVGAIPSLAPDGIARARASSNALWFRDPPARLRALVEQQMSSSRSHDQDDDHHYGQHPPRRTSNGLGQFVRDTTMFSSQLGGSKSQGEHAPDTGVCCCYCQSSHPTDTRVGCGCSKTQSEKKLRPSRGWTTS